MHCCLCPILPPMTEHERTSGCGELTSEKAVKFFGSRPCFLDESSPLVRRIAREKCVLSCESSPLVKRTQPQRSPSYQTERRRPFWRFFFMAWNLDSRAISRTTSRPSRLAKTRARRRKNNKGEEDTCHKLTCYLLNKRGSKSKFVVSLVLFSSFVFLFNIITLITLNCKPA